MADSGAFHENLTRLGEVKLGSNRNFGLVFAAVFALIGLLPVLSGAAVRGWALVVALGFLLAAVVRPALLALPKRLWGRFGLLLHKIMGPIILGLLFLVAVTPTAIVGRLLKRDPLRLRFEPGAATYWVERKAHGPDPATMWQQF
jgi:Saxitoxin biosynthesis operon protein SxtJ